MVGGAVRHGARGRGGLGYQLLAVALTYACIVSTYVPMVRTEMIKGMNERSATTQQSNATTHPSRAAMDDNPIPRKHWSVGKRIGFESLVLLVSFIFAIFLPILAGFSNIIGLLIIGFALWEAWKINKRVNIQFTGPFAVGAMPAPPLPGSAAP
jgi:hypothetical protein